jgi:hypothetical protein
LRIRTRIFLFSGGVILCLFILLGIKYGWFTWRMLENPPESVGKIIAIRDTSIWIKGSSGKIFFNNNSSACRIDCWVIVSEPPTETILREGTLRRMDTNCSSPLPFIGAIDSMAECRQMQWSMDDSLYVLRFDGKLFGWHFSSGGELSLLSDFFFYCFILAIVIFSIVVIIIWLRKAKKIK